MVGWPVVRAPLLGLLLLLVAALPAAALAPPDFTAVDEAALDAVASGEIPGVVVLVGRGDTVLYQRAFGARTVVPRPAPMTLDTIFDVASLTKPVATALAVMALVERGRVALDAPVGRYLDEFRGAAFRDVTIRRLLAHTAGLPALPVDATLADGFPAAARLVIARGLASTPGTGFRYGDTAYIVLGEVVRRASGEPLDRFLGGLLLEPLGLRDTIFRPGAELRPRIAPTQFARRRLLQGEVHDPRARLLGGVTGHAGLFSTAADLARIGQMLLAGGELDGVRVFRPETIRTMWAPAPETRGEFALGWDVRSAFARRMAPFFPPASVGHTGYTGTMLWLDPESRSYVIVLSNRVHPSGGGGPAVLELRQRVAAAVGAALFAEEPPATVARAGSRPAAPAAPPPRPAAPPVQTGLDVLVAQQFAPLRGETVGLVTNHTGIDARGRRNIDLIRQAPGVRLAAIFSPEHGLGGDLNRPVPHGRDAATGLPIYSLYGAHERPTRDMLRGITTLVFDIQDVGVRYYTYLTTLLYVMQEAARRDIPVMVLDRPNPITGRTVEGPIMDPDLRSFTGPHPIPVRTGLTMGEFARLVAGEQGLGVRLAVVPMAHWDRERWFDETGLPWVNPSPNIRSVTQALLYAGVGLLEATNLSVGRGTDTPFEVVGAPWLEPEPLAAAMNRQGLAGVRFEPIRFTPADDKHAGVECGGLRLVVTDREAIRPVTVGLALAVTLRAHHREHFRPESVQNLLVHRPTMWAFLRGEPVGRLLAWAEADRPVWLGRRAPYLIYP
jgi:uncharacterized protein YbbC (DUF1343 family)/CubicO group peptidase (beta-lactamase class C family)